MRAGAVEAGSGTVATTLGSEEAGTGGTDDAAIGKADGAE